uniref:Metallophos domain-containing protein n=1 Tax=Panagrellus redivivus TaxID=6233 RepID=A0A7E4ZWA2_PANRE
MMLTSALYKFIWLLCAIAVFMSMPISGATKKVLQLSDFHFDAEYSINGDPSEMCHTTALPKTRAERVSTDTLGTFGDYMCDSPRILVQHALKSASQMIQENAADFELVLWTGDNVPHIENYTSEYVMSAINTTTSLMRQYFPTIQVLPVFGNHDYAPANAFPDNGSSIYTATYALWKDWIGADPNNEITFLKGGYYVYRPSPGVTYLMLNTNIYYQFNTAKLADIDDPGQQFQFMETVLCDAQQKGEIVHVVSHIPPGAFERTPNMTWMPTHFNDKFVNITLKYAKTIKWMLFGHHHTDTFHVVKDTNGTAQQLLLISPSVTPWFSDLPGAGSNNPTYRVIEYDDKTWDYVDIITYYINLTTLNANPETQWTQEYSFKDDYNLTEITAASMSALLDRFKQSDDAFFKYIQFNSALWKPELPAAGFRAAQLCSIEYVKLNDYYACLGKATTPADNHHNNDDNDAARIGASVEQLLFLIGAFLTFL